ncbi:hypothetical protein [Campylobacter helveticus]|uniref:Uncharacterized protein n=1 Tax=Campylobacter helveticus TaxID=28898 RepID=A0ABY3L312_9BACT|nr:hypothetical protein [Campylobacter helveticus]MCR2039349.1 hypothetical protein [Campylobacter helveticus]TXK57752.1 hypothetical protein FVD16_04140 [Campylobacter helveticus]
MKHDFYEFLEIEALLFVCAFIFALMGCMILSLISLALIHIVAVLYPLLWIGDYLIQKTKTKLGKRKEFKNA